LIRCFVARRCVDGNFQRRNSHFEIVCAKNCTEDLKARPTMNQGNGTPQASVT
jgi:hypothetical protein